MSARAQPTRGYRMRPAPRSRRRAGAKSRIHWDKVGRVTLVLVLAAVLVSYVSPALNFIDAWRDSRSEHSSLAELRQENQKLQERLKTLGGEAAAERSARQQGMVGPGEAAYYVRGLNP